MKYVVDIFMYNDCGTDIVMSKYIEQLSEDGEIQTLDNDLNEGLLRGLSVVGLMGKIRKLSTDIKRVKTVEEKLDLVGTQNLYMGLLVFTMTQFEPTKGN